MGGVSFIPAKGKCVCFHCQLSSFIYNSGVFFFFFEKYDYDDDHDYDYLEKSLCCM